MVSFAQSERVALCRTFLAVGPDSPTLCEGWATRDLAAHLVVRENRPDAALGLVVPALSDRLARIQDSVARLPWTQLVARFEHPARWAPFARGPWSEVANRAEYFVHHEDVLRAQATWSAGSVGSTQPAGPAPRSLPAALQDALWTDLQRMARMLLRRSPVAVRLTRTDGTASFVPRIPGAGNPEPAVELTGEPGELLLFVYGRDSHAVVDVDGNPAELDALRAAL